MPAVITAEKTKELLSTYITSGHLIEDSYEYQDLYNECVNGGLTLADAEYLIDNHIRGSILLTFTDPVSDEHELSKTNNASVRSYFETLAVSNDKLQFEEYPDRVDRLIGSNDKMKEAISNAMDVPPDIGIDVVSDEIPVPDEMPVPTGYSYRIKAKGSCKLQFYFGEEWHSATTKIYKNGTIEVVSFNFDTNAEPRYKKTPEIELKTDDEITVNHTMNGHFAIDNNGNSFIDSFRIRNSELTIVDKNEETSGGAGMSKGIYLGVSKPAQVVLTPSNIGKYFTITPVSNNLIFTQDAGDNYFYPEPMEDYNYFQMRFTALKDIVLDVTYNCSVIDTASLFVISNGVFNSENTGGYGEGTGRTTIKQGDFLQVTLSLATVDARNDIILFKLSAIEAGSSVARKVKKVYVGVKTEVPVSETVSNVALTKDKFNELFADDVGGGSAHKWISQIDNAGNIKWCPDNLGKHNINSMSFFKAKQDMTLSFDYNYTTELNYDKVSISIGDLTSGSTFTPVTIIANALSGVDGSSSWSGNIKKGQYLRFAYSKDSSGNAANESVWVENFKATYTAQTGTTLKEIARKVKKAYIGVNGVARLCYSSE